ncbi:Hypothetical predicted protein [Paramuricea clavata]|uniref:Uncharacterized protein n=1 Tax=Paramuricea clavata TaxID=317549 RepID=A0A7D9HWH0_PARCT|nr:Hypothetical predicted protein [Paramuricea clavata]
MQYDIVCVCETWLNDFILDNEILPGYTIHRKGRRDNMRGGGVHNVAVRNELRSSKKLLLEGEQSEPLMMELYPVNCTKPILGVFYRPPNSDVDTLKELRNSLDRLEESCQLVLVSDLNLPDIDWSMDFPSPTSQAGFKEELFCDIIADQFLYENIDGPTHLRGNKLDCVLCNVPELITDVNFVNPTDLFPSDHYFIKFDIKLCFQKAKASTSKNINLNMTPKTDQEISQIQISEYEVEQCLNNLDTSKAYGPDGIPPRLLKECSKEISPSLCSLFNKSLATGRVSVGWKQTNGISIHKKDRVEPVTNYRSISLLSILSNVLERSVFNSICLYD